MSKSALTVENLTKVYSDSKNKKENKALNDLNFQVKQGEIFGLLGPNGAGKTTFLSILGGTVSKTKGNINVWGFDIDKNPRQVKASIGIVPQEVNLDAFFSPKKLLELQAGLYGVTRKDRITDLILKMVALENKANAYSRSLSGGMKRRLLIAKAMVHQPPILILDEPTAGVDVELRNNLWKNVKRPVSKVDPNSVSPTTSCNSVRASAPTRPQMLPSGANRSEIVQTPFLQRETWSTAFLKEVMPPLSGLFMRRTE